MDTEQLDFVGRIIGNWQLLRLLGEGTFGAVYDAQHQNISGRRAAVKILHPQMALNADAKRRFVNEASAASRAEHENIVQVFDGGVTQDGLCYVVMELLRGQTLSSVIQAGRLSVARTVNIGVQVASALQAAHSIGIIHRDLKPDNILVVPRSTNAEFVKVLDFGIAKLHDDDQKTKSGMWLGTPAYMSPEQWQTLPDIDGRSDLYSLGVILYKCLTGETPFSANNHYGWLTAHLNDPIPDLAAKAQVPPAICALVRRLLAKNRDERPRTAVDVINELRLCVPLQAEPGNANIVSGPLPVQSLPSLDLSPWVRLEPSNPSSPSTMRLGTGQVDRTRRSVRPLPFVAGAVVVVGLCGGIALLRNVSSPKETPAATVSQPPAPPERSSETKRPREAEKPALPALPGEMVVLGPGRFDMGWGSKKNRPDGPAHAVGVAAFAIGKQEVSMGDFHAYATEAGLGGALPWTGVDDFESIRKLPVNQITREQAQGYCRWKYGQWGGRLPSEAEWEFAARDGKSQRHYTWDGDRFDSRKANAGGKGREPLPVDSLREGATEHGLLNMLGNVAEWTAGDAAPYPASIASLRPGAVIRGGGINTAVKDTTATARISVDPNQGYAHVGFRCAADAR